MSINQTIPNKMVVPVLFQGQISKCEFHLTLSKKRY